MKLDKRKSSALDMDFEPNHLYYGDCLDVMHSWPSKSVDLIYVQPPSNSNVTASGPQGENIRQPDRELNTFTDMWTWTDKAEQRLKRLQHTTHPVERAIRASAIVLKHTDMLAYITYMAERLTQMKRILKPTGAIYVHCDSTASHYLKQIMDVLFGPKNYRNEIIWCPTGGRVRWYNSNSKNFSESRETILFYGMPKHQFKACYEPDPHAEKRYQHVDEHNRRFTLMPLWRSPSMDSRPNLNFEWRGYVNPHPSGWIMTKDNLERLYQDGRIYIKNDRPYRIRYMDEDKGKLVSNVWTDINQLHGINTEFPDFPPQKPLALLERILNASSNEGNLVLDPFCGYGTTVEAGLKLRRQIIGIDTSMLALDVINTVRLLGKYPSLPIKGFHPFFESDRHTSVQQMHSPRQQFPIDFEPANSEKDIEIIYQLKDAFHNDFKAFSHLVKKERYQFQDWAVQQIGMIPNRRKSSDGNIDGAGELVDAPYDNYQKIALAQVKSGKSTNWKADIERFCYTLDSENAAYGVFITLHPIGAKSPAHKIVEQLGNITVGNKTYPRLQLWSVEEFYVNGTRPNLPPLVDPYMN